MNSDHKILFRLRVLCLSNGREAYNRFKNDDWAESNSDDAIQSYFFGDRPRAEHISKAGQDDAGAGLKFQCMKIFDIQQSTDGNMRRCEQG